MDKNLTTKALVSVLMPVYNAEKFLSDAIGSILVQTFTNFEFIIINDGSTDRSESIIQSYQDDRIKYHANAENIGIVATLNKGLDLAQGKYIARMDADDISLPERLALQFRFMEANPLFAVCGAQAINIDEKGNQIGMITVPETDNEVKVQLLFKNVFIHPLTFFRSEIIKQYSYSPKHQYAEDYYLLAQIAAEHAVENLKEPLLLYRVHHQNITSTKMKEMKQAHLKVLDYQISNLLNKKTDPIFLAQYYALSNHDFQTYSLPDYRNILDTLFDADRKSKRYDDRTFHSLLYLSWYNLLRTSGGKNAIFYFFSSPLFSWHDLTFKQFRRIIKTSMKALFQ